VNLAQLRSPQIPELGGAVALLPVGAVEPHGPHAPLGTDTLISEGICRRAAAAAGAVVLPTLPYGVTRYGAAFPGAVGVSEATLRALVVDVCEAALEQGFRAVVIVNSHFEPEQVATLRAAAGDLGDRVALLDLTRRANATRLTREFQDGSCHAGRYETSLVLAEAPALVDAEQMARLPELAVDMPKAIAAGRTDFVAMGMHEAYCGAPAEATAAEGEATFAALTELLLELVREC
jgi:creatinine amidohydrolase